jgi:hypothetical protein
MKLLTDEEIEKRILPGEYRVMHDVKLGTRLQLEEDIKGLDGVLNIIERFLFPQENWSGSLSVTRRDWQSLIEKILGGEL